MALKYDINANTRQAQAETKNVGEALEKVSDALDGVARDGDKSGEKLERSFRDLARDAKRAGDDVGDDVKRGFKRAGDASDDFRRDGVDNVKEFKSEAIANLSEVASSWQGDIEGMADGVQGLTGGLAASLTPGIGIPVAILGAAAAAFTANWVKAAEDAKAQVSSMYADMTESGATFVSEDFIGQQISDIAEDTGKWEAANQRVQETGLGIGTILRAMAGDQNAIAAAHATYVKQRDDEVQKVRESNRSIEEQAVLVDAANTKFANQVEWITQVQRNTGTAADKAMAYRDAMGQAASNAQRTADNVRGIADRTITINTRINDDAFASFWSSLQARAASGITVNARPGQGRFWE